MKKILFIIGLILVIGLAFSSQKTETKIVDDVFDEELVFEEWMTKPFNIDK